MCECIQRLDFFICGHLQTIDVLLLCFDVFLSRRHTVFNRVQSCIAILSQEDHNGNRSQTLLCVYPPWFYSCACMAFSSFMCACFLKLNLEGSSSHLCTYTDTPPHTGCPHPCPFLSSSTSYSLTSDVPDILDTWQSFTHISLCLVTRVPWLCPGCLITTIHTVAITLSDDLRLRWGKVKMRTVIWSKNCSHSRIISKKWQWLWHCIKQVSAIMRQVTANLVCETDL